MSCRGTSAENAPVIRMLDAYTKEPYYAIKNLKIPVLYYRSFAEQEHELARHRDYGSGLPNKGLWFA
jgi:hypothetical protein